MEANLPNFQVGDRVILELKSGEIFQGIYADGGKGRIVLNNVIQHNNKNNLGDLFEFYLKEIAKIHTLESNLLKKKEKPENENPVSYSDTIKIEEKEYFRLKDMSKDYIYIENADKRYYDAVKVLSDSESIGIVFLGVEKYRSGNNIALLVMCNWKQVYIFDLIHLEKGYIYPEIRDILESQYICKVIHKSAGLVDILYRRYNIYIKNTFDTLIVDLIIDKKKNGECPSIERSLSECLYHHLNLPTSILEQALSVPLQKWSERPLDKKFKHFASQIATYLILLKEHLQKLLLKDVYDAIVKVQDYVYDLDEFEFSNYVSKKEVSKDIKKILTVNIEKK